MSKNEEGAFTGEVSARMLRDINVSYALCGHSERRRYHSNHENDESTHLKIKQSVKYDITPIICIGESKEDRDAGRTEEAIHKQLQILLDEVNIHKVIIGLWTSMINRNWNNSYTWRSWKCQCTNSQA